MFLFIFTLVVSLSFTQSELPDRYTTYQEIEQQLNDWSEEFHDMDKRLSYIEFKTDDIKSVKKKIVLTKQCDCDTDETEKGIVLDPFGGSGTTGLVADRLKRNAVLIELNPDYVEIMRKRLEGDAPLFTDIDINEINTWDY